MITTFGWGEFHVRRNEQRVTLCEVVPPSPRFVDPHGLVASIARRRAAGRYRMDPRGPLAYLLTLARDGRDGGLLDAARAAGPTTARTSGSVAQRHAVDLPCAEAPHPRTRTPHRRTRLDHPT